MNNRQAADERIAKIWRHVQVLGSVTAAWRALVPI
jgi:hypothetical protein